MGTDQIPVSKRANLAERLVVQQMQKKALGQVLSFVSVVSMAPDKCINRVPVNSAQQRIRRPSYRKSSVSVTSLNSTISLFLNTFFQLLWRIVAVDFPARNLGYLLSSIGQGAAAAAPGSSQQWCPRVSGEEAFDSLGSFLGCLLRISSAQLASLDSIRDCLIDLRWNPRLTSSGREYHVLK